MVCMVCILYFVYQGAPLCFPSQDFKVKGNTVYNNQNRNINWILIDLTLNNLDYSILYLLLC